MKDNPFNSGSLGNLVSTDYSLGVESVNNVLKDTDMGSATPCYICGRPATHQVIPKKMSLFTAFIQSKGYICDNCLQMKYLDSKNYGVRPLK